MKKFLHTIILKISNFKLSDYIEISGSTDVTRW